MNCTEEVPSTQTAALLAGPLSVECIAHLRQGAAGHRWAVVGGERPTRLGLPLHCHRRHLGHVFRLAPERREALRAQFHVVHYLATNPEALALVLEALGSEVLAVLGRALARRVESRLP